jgi:hypothetical protein
MNPNERVELQHLLSALCDGELTDVEHARLEELLRANSGCRRHYLEYMDLHARLLVHPGVPAAAEEPAAPASGRRWPQFLRYALVAATTLAASLLLQVFWRPAPQPAPDNKTLADRDKLRTPIYLATLTQTADCVWDHAPAVGPRLQAGELRLQKGVARIRFDSGCDLVVEGPADLQLDSASSATLRRGKVVFRADETAAPFDLHTPASTLVDLGAEYAVAVGPEGEEIHVFGGEVHRTPRKTVGLTEPEHLTAGQARGYGPTPAAPARPTQLDPKQFVRQLAPPGVLPPDAVNLLAYEGFDYQSADALRTGKANGGFGWTSPWTPGFARPLLEGDTNLLALNVKEGLSRQGSAVTPVGGSFEYLGFAKYHRRLATPVRLDVDGVYFVSFLFRREGPPADPLNALAILFRTTEELQRGKDDAKKRLNVGVGGANQLFTHLGGVGCRTHLPLRYGETYLLVAKIVASGTGPDQVFMRVYGPEDGVDREEPAGWTVAGPTFQSDMVFDWMEIHINSKTRQTIDEIRLGTTWSAVTGPWLGG